MLCRAMPCLAQGAGLTWLFPLVDGAPPAGWGTAAAYLVLPVLLVVSQYISMKVIQPSSQNNDPAQQQTQAILKFLPLMIGGWSSCGPGRWAWGWGWVGMMVGGRCGRGGRAGGRVGGWV